MKKLLKILVINLALMVALLIPVELFFGSWFGANYGNINIPRDVDRQFDVSGLYGRDELIRYTRDANGLRGPYEDPGQIDILTLGGSTTNQLYLDNEETWQAHMRRLFVADANPMTIVNAAVDGQSTFGHIQIFEKWFPLIEGLKARYVLAYVGINDVGLDVASKFDDMASPDPMRRLKQYVSNNSAVYYVFGVVQGMVRASRINAIHGASPFQGRAWFAAASLSDPVVPAEIDQPLLPMYRERLIELHRRIVDFGATPIFVTQPTAEFRVEDGQIIVPDPQDPDVEPLLAYRRMMSYNQVTLDVCEDFGGICIDLARQVSFVEEDFYDRLHNTPSGAEKVGRVLFDALRGLD